MSKRKGLKRFRFKVKGRAQVGEHAGTVLAIHGERGELVTIKWDVGGTS